MTAVGRVRLKRDGTRRRKGREVKGKLANGVGIQYHSHYFGTWCVSSITTADAHTSAEMTLPPRRFKWTHPFRRKTKSGFCACAITFQAQSTSDSRSMNADLHLNNRQTGPKLHHEVLKVKSLCVIKHRAKKTYGGIQTQLQAFLILVYMQVTKFPTPTTSPPRAVSLFPVTRRVVPAEHEAGGPHIRSEHPTFSTLS
jgi:hypothetical protein